MPIAPLEVTARVVRPGRRVELCEASLSDERGEVMRARAWRLRTEAVELPAESPASAEDPPPAREGEPGEFFPTGQDVGYHTAMEYRFVRGGFLEPGPATVWMRMAVPLVAGEEPTPLAARDGRRRLGQRRQRRARLAALPLHQRRSQRPPAPRCPRANGSASTRSPCPEPSGIGLSDTLLGDERGRIGRAAQTLLVAERAYVLTLRSR